MTIIEPNRAEYSYNAAPLLLSFVLVGLVLLNIYIYNENVGLKHLISGDTKDLQSAQLANAELKNQLYKITDLSSLNSLVKANGLVKESKPKYFEKASSGSLAVN